MALSQATPVGQKPEEENQPATPQKPADAVNQQLQQSAKARANEETPSATPGAVAGAAAKKPVEETEDQKRTRAQADQMMQRMGLANVNDGGKMLSQGGLLGGLAMVLSLVTGGKISATEMLDKLSSTFGMNPDGTKRNGSVKPAETVLAANKPGGTPAAGAVKPDTSAVKPAEPAFVGPPKPDATVAVTPASPPVKPQEPVVSSPSKEELAGLGAANPKSDIVIEARSYENTGVNGTPYTAVVTQAPEPALRVDAAAGTSNLSLSGQGGAFNNKADPNPADVRLVDAKVEQAPVVAAQFDVSTPAANQSFMRLQA